MGIFINFNRDNEEVPKPADNFVYKQNKRARYKNIELCEGDLITDDIYAKNRYIIRDFEENGCPYVELVTTEANKKGEIFLWEFDNLFVIKNTFQ